MQRVLNVSMRSRVRLGARSRLSILCITPFISTNKRKKVLGNYQTHGRIGDSPYKFYVTQTVMLSALYKRDARIYHTYIPIFDMK